MRNFSQKTEKFFFFGGTEENDDSNKHENEHESFPGERKWNVQSNEVI